jgi:hypothetical protein
MLDYLRLLAEILEARVGIEPVEVDVVSLSETYPLPPSPGQCLTRLPYIFRAPTPLDAFAPTARSAVE